MNTQYLKGYARLISEATGRTDPKEIDAIEDMMRHDIFHSTLDWQTKEQLMKAAVMADAILSGPISKWVM